MYMWWKEHTFALRGTPGYVYLQRSPSAGHHKWPVILDWRILENYVNLTLRFTLTFYFSVPLTFMVAIFNYWYSHNHVHSGFFSSVPRMLPSLHYSPPHLTHNLMYPCFSCHLLQDNFPGSFRWNSNFLLNFSVMLCMCSGMSDSFQLYRL